jgi:rare lipoprotein A (peptidoglycan hydrolase)
MKLEYAFVGLGLLVLTPTINPVVVSRANNPASALQGAVDNNPVRPQPKAKPLAVWTCLTGWYGRQFDGQQTANGETYNMYATTAAHPTLPLGSLVRVINLRNHRSQVVRINDRGPYQEGREMDVSYEVARRLGFDRRGVARVRLELLRVPPRPLPEHLN